MSANRARRATAALLTALLALTLGTAGVPTATAAAPVSVTVSGKVTDGTAPLEGATLEAYKVDFSLAEGFRLTSVGSVTSRTDGTFPAMSLDPATQYLFRVGLDGYTPEYFPKGDALLSVSSGRLSIGTIALDPASRLRGKVLNHDGTPAVGATVETHPLGEDEPGDVATTGADGSYALWAKTGAKVRLVVLEDKDHAPTYLGGGTTLSTAKSFAPTTPEHTVATITRTRGATVAARLYVNGGPVGKNWHFMAHVYDPGTATWRQVAVAQTDSAGNVRIDGLHPGVPYRFSLKPVTIVRSGDVYPDWPYYLGGGSTAAGGPGTKLSAGANALGNLHTDKLNPPRKHGLYAPVLSKSKQTYGHSKVATVTVRHALAKTGKVTFRTDRGVVGTANLVDGRASLKLPKTLPVGTRFVSATMGAFGSGPAVLVVEKSRLAKKPTITGKAFRKNTRPKVTVTLGKLNNGTYPAGKVKVYVGSKAVKTVTITKRSKGKVSVTLPKRYAKLVKVRATYLGNGTTAKATTKVRAIRTR